MKLMLLMFPVFMYACKPPVHTSATPIDPTGAAYSQAFEIKNAKRMLFVSGQVPEDEKGNVPADFKSQCRLAWKNVETQLKKAGMELTDIVKFTVFLSDRK